MTSGGRTLTTQSAQGMVLMVSDALAFTDPSIVTREGRDILVKALRRSLHSDVSQADEEQLLDDLLDHGFQVTAFARDE